jgi:hypothetical protein
VKTLICATKVLGREADAVIVEGGRIAAVGWAAELRQPGMGERSHPGRVIAPGLHDHHFHPFGYVSALTQPSLHLARDLDDLLGRLRAAAAILPPGGALIASRLDDEGLAERRLPTRHDLDRVVPDRPVLLYRYCGHLAVANTAALERAGIDAGASDPAGGTLDRDESGDPTGVLRETAIEPVSRSLASLASPVAGANLLRALRGLTSLGITRITAIISAGEGLWCGSGDEVATLVEIAPDLPLEVETLVIADTPAALESAATRLRQASGPVRFSGWKGFADGSLGGHTAALYEGYSDLPAATGTLRLDPDTATGLATASLGLGGEVAIHAIGDLANDRVLDLFEELIERGADPGRLRVEHASVLTDPAISRFGRLGVTASLQPAFLASEQGWLEKRLGRRIANTYPFRSLDQAGARLVGGSDCPVEPPNPWWGMAAAVDRSSAEALDARAAFDLFAEPLEVGSPANLLVLDRDPLEAPASELRRTTVVEVWRQGQRVALEPELAFV